MTGARAYAEPCATVFWGLGFPGIPSPWFLNYTTRMFSRRSVKLELYALFSDPPHDNRARCLEPFCVVEKVLYPALLLVAVWRIVLVRVRPDVLLTFEPYEGDRYDGSGPVSADGRKGFRSRLRSAWSTDGGLFSSADKGRWETISAGRLRPPSRETDWFRAGFEPVFASYTKRGVWFAVISLIEVGMPWPCSTTVLGRAGVRGCSGGGAVPRWCADDVS